MTMRPLEGDQSLARAFHALGDSTRLDLLRQLRHGDMCVCDLMKAIRVGQSLVSFHLKVLKGAGLITDRRSGRWVYYSIVPDALARLGELLARDGRLATRTMEEDSQ